MPKTIKIACAQMDANPAPLAERLTRAEQQANQAAQTGAQLVVLPELFNTGYAYADANFGLAEPPDGPTATWMKQTAGHLGIHLAGTLLLLEDGEIYNALLLFSPNGEMWRYDKNYPWAWERAYFRERRGMTVAHTELGDFGMMICWDIGHPSLWQQYAGQVDLMLVASCPPDGTNPTYSFPDGSQTTLDDLGSMMATMKDTGKLVFGDMLKAQTAWLGVPAVNSGASGHIQTVIPRGRTLLLSLLLLAPKLTRLLPQANQLKMACDMIPSCKIVSANGQVLAERSQSQGEGFTIAEVTLPETRPTPRGPQPGSPLNRITYFNADKLVPFLMRSVYRKGIRQVLEKARQR